MALGQWLPIYTDQEKTFIAGKRPSTSAVCLCKRREKWPIQGFSLSTAKLGHGNILFYPSGELAHLLLSHPFCLCRTYFQQGLLVTKCIATQPCYSLYNPELVVALSYSGQQPLLNNHWSISLLHSLSLFTSHSLKVMYVDPKKKNKQETTWEWGYH